MFTDVVVVVQLFASLSFALHYVFYWQCSIYPNGEFMHCILIFVFDFFNDVYLFYLEFILQYPKHNDTTDIFMILYISELMNIFSFLCGKCCCFLVTATHQWRQHKRTKYNFIEYLMAFDCFPALHKHNPKLDLNCTWSEHSWVSLMRFNAYL